MFRPLINIKMIAITLVYVLVIMKPFAINGSTIYEQDFGVGQRVILKLGVELSPNMPANGKVKSEVGQAGAPPKSQLSQLVIYRVERVKKPWLELVPEEGGSKGWINANQAVRFEQAIGYLDSEVRGRPRPAAYLLRGGLHARIREHDKALADFTEAIRLDPNNVAAYLNRGQIWSTKREHDKALADFTEAIRLDQTNEQAFRFRGLTRAIKREHDKALADFTEAIRLDPKSAWAFYNRGLVWSTKREHDKALADFTEAIRLDPNNANAYNAKANILATCPDVKLRDGKRAVEAARRACELSNWKMARYLDTLAAAFAETGNLEQAARYQRDAIKILENGDNKRMLDQYKSKLNKYINNK